jgi:hypothetical protein
MTQMKALKCFSMTVIGPKFLLIIAEGEGMLHIMTVKGAEILYNTMQGAETLYDNNGGGWNFL